MNGGLLYRLDFSSGKSYIGITTRPMPVRLEAHRKSTRYESRSAIHAAWRKYGEPALVKLAIVEKEDLAATERRAIETFKTMTPFGYNLLRSGGAAVYRHAPETIEKMAAAKRGKKQSEETRRRRSESLKRSGRVWSCSQDTREKIRRTLLGRKPSAEERAKMSAKAKGRKRTAEHQAKLNAAVAAALTGRKLPPEVIAKREATRKSRRLQRAPKQMWRPLSTPIRDTTTGTEYRSVMAAARALNIPKAVLLCEKQSHAGDYRFEFIK